MPKCGDCKNIWVQIGNSAADGALCNAQLDEEGLGMETTIYTDAGNCPHFEQLERVRTDVYQFMHEPGLRTARGFDEK
ncbi:MAG: hypothetical protein SVW57_12535 [Thermodesulfobacteriota bacterium]|nr:hypothetical protein [Thermodesulfobacteriota bacterium]